MKRILAALAAAAIIATGIVGHSYKTRPYIIDFSPGGVISDFIEEYDAVRRSGRRVVIDSLCLSACTLVIGLVPLDRVCVTPYAQLGFHSAWFSTPFGPAHSSEGTRLIWQVYPENVRQLLRKRGWDGGVANENQHQDLIYLSGDDLRSLIRSCDG
jgi:hypothetical protein